MSSVIRPVGPQPPAVYWVRRVVTLVVLAAVVAGVVWFLGGRGSGDPGPDGAAPATSMTPGPTRTSTPTTSTSPTPTKTRTKAPDTSPTTTTSPSRSGTHVAACRDKDIKVTASTDAATYRVGDTPALRMRITNVSDTSCRRDVGSAPNELIVNKGTTRFWSSDDCNPRGTSDVVVLAPGQAYSVSLTWLGEGSSRGCPADPPEADAGSYSLVGRNGDVLSAPARFSLT